MGKARVLRYITQYEPLAMIVELGNHVEYRKPQVPMTLSDSDSVKVISAVVNLFQSIISKM